MTGPEIAALIESVKKMSREQQRETELGFWGLMADGAQRQAAALERIAAALEHGRDLAAQDDEP